MNIVEAIKANVESDVQRLIDHPFNQAMLDESLSKQQYTYYCVQDDLYLDVYARALAMIAVKLPRRDEMALFLRFALEAVDQELALHQQQIRIEPELALMYRAKGMNQGCMHYRDFLLAHASVSSLELGLAAILPCFYVYLRVGCAMKASSLYHANHRYRAWIDVYASDEFEIACDQAFAVLAQCAHSDAGYQEIMHTFAQGVGHEYAFWQAALCPVI